MKNAEGLVSFVTCVTSRVERLLKGLMGALGLRTVTWVCNDDARTRAEGIFEVRIRRDSVYALVLVSHFIPFVFDVKLA